MKTLGQTAMCESAPPLKSWLGLCSLYTDMRTIRSRLQGSFLLSLNQQTRELDQTECIVRFPAAR